MPKAKIPGVDLRFLSKPHCKRGHSLSGDNVHKNGKSARTCRACYLERLDKHIAKLRHPELDLDVSHLDPDKYISLTFQEMKRIPGYTFIYRLNDPIDHWTKYIGKSVNPKQRFRSHKSLGDTQTSKNNWVTWLRFYGFQPEIQILDIVPNVDASYAEAQWVHYGRLKNWPLLNYNKPRITKRTSLKEPIELRSYLEAISA